MFFVVVVVVARTQIGNACKVQVPHASLHTLLVRTTASHGCMDQHSKSLQPIEAVSNEFAAGGTVPIPKPAKPNYADGLFAGFLFTEHALFTSDDIRSREGENS
jgi:hypothetical protein